MARHQISAVGSRVPRSAVVVIGCLLLGLAAGALISSFALARKAPRVSDADYVLMVANLFDHEKSVFNARERLSVLGRDPLELTASALDQYSRERPQDRAGIDSLRQLDQGLRQAEADAASQRAASNPGLVGVVGLILASVLVAAGAAWLWKLLETRGMSMPRLAVGQPRQPRTSTGRGGFASALATVVGRPAPAGSVELRDAEAELDKLPSRARPNGFRPRLEPIEAPPPLSADRSARRRVSAALPFAPMQTAPSPERLVYQALYTLGEESFDDVHTIVDADGEIVGAVGLSATESSDRPGRFYGFTAWLQDQGGRTQELSAVGLVTRSGQIARSAAIAEWRRRGTIDDVHPVERGLQIGLRTSRIDALISVEDFDYTPPAHGSPGYFARLAVRFEVSPAD